jgi:hypothetical protein
MQDDPTDEMEPVDVLVADNGSDAGVVVWEDPSPRRSTPTSTKRTEGEAMPLRPVRAARRGRRQDRQ